MRKSFVTSARDSTLNHADLPRSASGGGFGIPTFKAFKVPSLKTTSRVSTIRAKRGAATPEDSPSVLGKRRDRVYDENDFYATAGTPADDYDPRAEKRAKKAGEKAAKEKAAEESDDDAKKKRGFVDKYVAPRSPRKFPVYKPKTGDVLVRKFELPGMKKKGMLLENRLTGQALGTRRAIEMPPRPLHDPMEGNAIVLWDPTVDDREEERLRAKLEAEKDKVIDEGEAEDEKERKKFHRSLAEILGIKTREEMNKVKVKVPVVIDPRVGKVLRPHQVEGVKFLYKCVTGMIDEGAQGCIMADEMGLGKTLQCITLLWTLLKQSPLPGKSSIDKAIVVCPSSLVRNWANELVKWLGEGAVSPLAIDGKVAGQELVAQVRQWCATKGKGVVTPIVIVSYEKLRTLTEELGQTEVGLLLADEGHRLKNSVNQTYTALNQINCKRRVILTGTPIQNDLDEYFSLLNFCNPGYLGTKIDFHKKFELPIIKGRDGDATDREKEVGDATLKELGATVNKFIIRRTNDLLSKYLPVKYEHVVFCSLSPFQLALYKFFMESPAAKALLKGKDSQPLKAITLLRKLCNHPDLLNMAEDLPGAEGTFPEGYDPYDKRRKLDPELSGKMAVLDRRVFLDKMARETNDKIVLISNFTTTLDQFEKLCNARRYGWVRLDGTMNPTKRQKLVDKFNDPEGKELVFLLSSKAGGCGINLIGANRLVLFDPDWNPASDMQALARVWRDGQKKDCFVYRFVATGTVEEKIFQRQSHKQNLSSCVVDSKEDIERHYTGDNLRQLFQYKDRACETHDLFKCKRCRDGRQVIKAPAMLYGDTSTWNHLTNDCLKNIHDDLLRNEYSRENVTACFQYIST
ncbi:hypothetical protein MNV49_001623 [Pseudohyphozyma bogoriensis]|nr:hypothetical protein MNV49_001623 [Pseudohyphozyma bogoriensis]